MRRLSLAVLVGALVLDAACPAVTASDPMLMAGVASLDITPTERLPMWGYSDRTAPVTGKLDPLMAKILALGFGDERVAVITLDLGRTPDEEQLAELRALTQKRCGVEKLFVTASHTHQAPSLEAYGDTPNAYVRQLLPKLSEAVAAAAEKLEPVSLAMVRGSVDLAHNRRRVLADGRVAMQWRNVERDRTEPVDREIVVTRLDRQSGQPLTVLVHYACHPVVLGSDHDRYSADYVGAMRDVVESELGTTCLFLQGACGDINPYMDKTPVAQGGVEEMRRMGQTLGRAVLEAAHKATTGSGNARLDFIREDMPVRVRWDINDPQVRSVLSSVYGRRFDQYLAPRLKAGVVPLQLTTLVINGEVALVGIPGEIFVQFQLDLKRQSPVAHTLLVGYANGYHAYFPTIRDAALGGYGGKTATYVAVGTAERLADEALITLHELAGQLSATPRLDDFRLLEWDDVKPPVSKGAAN